MATQDFVPRNDILFCSLLSHLVATLPQFYGQLGITVASPQVVTLLADEAAFAYVCTRQVTLSLAAEGATGERNRARRGDPAHPEAAVDLSYPTKPAPVPNTILPGVERRLRNFAQFLRTLPGYDAAVGEALHLVGEDTGEPDPATLQPELRRRISGLNVEVGWGWGDAADYAKALHLEVDRGTGPVYLATDTNPNYIDTAPIPAQPTKWRYRGMWVRDAVMIGVWSDWTEITVSV